MIFAQAFIVTMLYDKKNKFKVAMPQFHFQFIQDDSTCFNYLRVHYEDKINYKKARKENKDQCINKMLCMTCKTVSNEFGTECDHVFTTRTLIVMGNVIQIF